MNDRAIKVVSLLALLASLFTSPVSIADDITDKKSTLEREIVVTSSRLKSGNQYSSQLRIDGSQLSQQLLYHEH